MIDIDIGSIVKSINNCISELQEQLKDIQSHCPHDTVYSTEHSNTEGIPFYECRCVHCGKWWTEEFNFDDEEDDEI